jgi:hypothetical protein
MRRRRRTTTLESLGHVIKRDETRLCKNIYESKPEDRTNMGRSRLGWLKDVENDLRELKVSRWWKKK